MLRTNKKCKTAVDAYARIMDPWPSVCHSSQVKALLDAGQSQRHKVCLPVQGCQRATGLMWNPKPGSGLHACCGQSSAPGFPQPHGATRSTSPHLHAPPCQSKVVRGHLSDPSAISVTDLSFSLQYETIVIASLPVDCSISRTNGNIQEQMQR